MFFCFFFCRQISLLRSRFVSLSPSINIDFYCCQSCWHAPVTLMLWPCRAINYIYITAVPGEKREKKRKKVISSCFIFFCQFPDFQSRSEGNLSSPSGRHPFLLYCFSPALLHSTPNSSSRGKTDFWLTQPPQSFTVPTVNVCLKLKYRILLTDSCSLCSACPQIIFFSCWVLILGPFTGIIWKGCVAPLQHVPLLALISCCLPVMPV